MILPEKLGAGLSFSQLVTNTAYPAPDWSLSVALRGPSAITIQGTAEGAQHRIDIAASTSASWPPGVYWYSVRVSRGPDVIEIENGRMVLASDLAAEGANYDGRSHAQRTLDAIEAVIERRASLDQERYRINNRELYRTPIADLLKLRNLYRSEVRQEQAAARGSNLFGASVRVRLR